MSVLLKRIKKSLPELTKDIKTTVSVMSQKPFIGYAGWTGYGNLGDEAVYQAVKNLIPEIKTFAIDERVQWVMQKTKRSLPMQAFFLGGGTLINRSTDWFEIAKYAQEEAIPSFCLGTGVAASDFWTEYAGDKFKDNINEWSKILNDFEFVGVRGPLSQQRLINAGVNSTIVGDSAFSLNVKSKTKNINNKTIGINICYGTDGVMWGNQNALIEQITNYIRLAIKNHYKVVLFPMWTDDDKLSSDIANIISNENCMVVKAYRSVDSYFEAISNCDIFIGEKLHATIFSCMLGIPSIMLAYRPKCFDFMESIEMRKYCIRTDEVSADSLWELTEELNANNQIKDNLTSYAKHYKDLQFKHSQKIRSRLRLG